MPDVMKYLPGYYRKSQVMTNITNAENIELQTFQANLTSTLDQFFVETATSALEKWERDLGIQVDNTKPWEQRRSVIKAKLRGTGTVTLDLIKNTAASYSNGEVDVIEDNSNNCFTIKFIGTIGIPPNIDDLENTIEEIKPAHLAYSFEYTFNTNNDISLFTHSHLAGYTHTQLREEEVI